MNSHRDDLKAYMDGELTEARRAEIETALANDAELRVEKEFYEMLNRSLRAHADAAVAEGNPQTLVDLLRAPRLPIWVRFAPIGAVAALVFVALILKPGSVGNSPATASVVAADSGIEPVKYTESAGIQSETSKGQGIVPQKAQFGSQGGEMRGRTKAKQEPIGAHNIRSQTNFLDSEQPASGTVPITSAAPQLIRTADLAVIVPEVKDALAHATRIAESEGGYVTDSSTGAEEGELATASATLRIPVKQFTATLTRLKKLGKVTSDSTGSIDVTAPIADMDARLRVLKAERESYIVMLRAANKVGEMLSIREQISNVTEEIESITAQLKSTRDQATYSTISLELAEKRQVDKPAPPKDWQSEVWTNAVAGLRDVGRSLGAAAIFAFVYSPIWLPVLILGIWGWRRSMRG